MSIFTAVSDCYGRIAEIALITSSAGYEAGAPDSLRRDFPGIYALGNGSLPGRNRKLYLLAYHLQDMPPAPATTPPGIEVFYINIARLPRLIRTGNFTPPVWIQDPFIVLSSGNGYRQLLEQIVYAPPDNLANVFIADHLAALHPDLSLKPFNHRVEGGNILVGDNFAFVNEVHNTHAAVEQELKAALNVATVLWVGADPAPIPTPAALFRDQDIKQLAVLGIAPFTVEHFPSERLDHIDMYVTLAGKDPYNSNKDLVFVARIGGEEDSSDQLSRAGIVGKVRDWDHAISMKKDLNTFFDGIARRIESFGRFTVRRMPMALDMYQISWRGGKREQHRYIRSYNNCLVEVDGSYKHLYLPDYNYQDTDRFTDIQKDITQSLGKLKMGTTWLAGDFLKKSDFSGSLRCMTKVLLRTT